MARNRNPITRTRSRDENRARPTAGAIPAGSSNGDAAPDPGSLRQISYSGTPSYGGMTRPDDYVPELMEPVRRMQTFEEMRFSDDGVHAALAAREHMIASSNWMLTSPDDKPASTEVLEFCEDNLYPFLDVMLGHLSGAIQYGFGMFEPVYSWMDEATVRNYIRGGVQNDTRKWGRRIFLQKIAHPRQRTIYTFRINATGDLLNIEQYAWNGFTFLRNLIPPDKLVNWTYKKQGDDYWGIPPTRHAYKAWTLKKQLEALNALGVDRFGAGTPVAEAGPAWIDQDYVKLEQYLKHWRVSDESYLIHPAGGKIELMSGDGSMTLAILDWTKYYKLCIAMTFLTQGSELGSTESGSRALGEIMLEQTETVIQSDDEAIANILNQRVIPKLVDWNFGPQEVYPQFVPSQRVRASSAFGTIITTLISSGAIKWTPKDEAWLRDAMHLPSIDLAARQAEYDAAQALAKQAAAAGVDPNADPNAKDPAVVGSIKPKPKAEPAAIERSSQTKQKALALSIPYDANGVVQVPSVGTAASEHRTAQYTAWELEVLRPYALSRDLDTASARVTGEAHDVLQAIDERLITQLSKYAVQGIDILTSAVRKLAVSASDRAKLRTILMDAARRARAYGESAVLMEAARQVSADPADVTPPPTVEYAQTDEEKQRDARIQAEVDAAVEDEVSRRESAIRGAALLAIHMAGALSVAELAKQAADAARNALQDLSVARLEDNIQGVVNTGFGVGRQDGASRLGDDIKAKVYSAAMDGGTCDACAPYDGAMYPPDYPEDARGVQAPNPKCFGRKRCRCVWMYVTAAEIPSAVPAERGAEGFFSRSFGRKGDDTQTLAVAERTNSLLERFLDRHKEKPINLTVAPAQVTVEPAHHHITIQMPKRGEMVGRIVRDANNNATVEIKES